MTIHQHSVLEYCWLRIVVMLALSSFPVMVIIRNLRLIGSDTEDSRSSKGPVSALIRL